MPHPPIIIPPITKTCPTCRQTKPEDQFRRVGTNTAVKNCLACRDRYRPGRKRLSEESLVVFDNTPLPTNSNTSNTSYQPIAPRPTQPVPHGGEQEHRTQNVFRVEPPKRKKVNRKKKDHREEEPQLMEIGSMVLGPMGPSFALFPGLQSNSCPRSETRERQNSTVDSTMSQYRGSSRPQICHGAETREQRVRTVDLTGPESQSRGSSRSVPPRPPTNEGGLNVRSMVLGPMGPSIALLPSLQSNSRSRERRGAETREQRVRTVDLTGPEPQSRGANSRPLPLRPQEHSSGSREQRVRTIISTEPQSRDSFSQSMPPRPQIQHNAERERQVRTIDSTEPQPRGASSQPPPPRPPTNEGDLEKYVSKCWDVGCTSCRSYSLRH